MDLYQGYNAYLTYLALRSHFTSDYDYYKYHGKVRASRESFLKRNDKFFFAKLEKRMKKNELVYFFVANFIDHDDVWVGNLVNDASEDIYTAWKKRIQSLAYNFKNECEYLGSYDFNSLFEVAEYSHPLLLRKYMQKEVSPETMVIMDSVLGFINRWNKTIDDTIIWPKVRDKLLNYKPFMSFDKDRYKKIMKETFINS